MSGGAAELLAGLRSLGLRDLFDLHAAARDELRARPRRYGRRACPPSLPRCTGQAVRGSCTCWGGVPAAVQLGALREHASSAAGELVAPALKVPRPLAPGDRIDVDGQAVPVLEVRRLWTLAGGFPLFVALHAQPVGGAAVLFEPMLAGQEEWTAPARPGPSSRRSPW